MKQHSKIIQIAAAEFSIYQALFQVLDVSCIFQSLYEVRYTEALLVSREAKPERNDLS